MDLFTKLQKKYKPLNRVLGVAYQEMWDDSRSLIAMVKKEKTLNKKLRMNHEKKCNTTVSRN